MGNHYSAIKDARAYDYAQDVYKVNSGIEQGNLCQWDSGSRVATDNDMSAAAASGVKFLGVAMDAHPYAGLGTDTRPLTGNEVAIGARGVFHLLTTTGETYSHGDPVYPAGPQTVTKVSASMCIGRVWLPGGTQITGAATTRVPVKLQNTMMLE